MKKIFLQILFIILLSATACIAPAQKVGIGTNTPNAALEVSSTTSGFLPPRLTIAQRMAINNAVIGLVIYCINCHEYEIYDGVAWKNMVGSPACVVLKICDQIWMTDNLSVSNYRNGDIIPQVTDNAVWSGLTTGAWCWYMNDSITYAATYGKLYNWYAVNDPRGLAPPGWHIPTDSEWIKLSTCLGGDALAGGKMKEAGTAHWQSPNTGATNSSGFTALPGGIRYVDTGGSTFTGINDFADFWSSTEATYYGGAKVIIQEFHWSDASLRKVYADKFLGLSVRCLKN